MQQSRQCTAVGSLDTASCKTICLLTIKHNQTGRTTTGGASTTQSNCISLLQVLRRCSAVRALFPYAITQGPGDLLEAPLQAGLQHALDQGLCPPGCRVVVLAENLADGPDTLPVLFTRVRAPVVTNPAPPCRPKQAIASPCQDPASPCKAPASPVKPLKPRCLHLSHLMSCLCTKSLTWSFFNPWTGSYGLNITDSSIHLCRNMVTILGMLSPSIRPGRHARACL